ncbi:bifunctional proline dehydrogenase/L-glutamate gamma-semialdehyde dehydrogenase PutA [Alginatibacterium sediminis]|uniref:Bifunctional protein PutA n=1 Tax=Alginatibacterium sediminis TaxID=2164068 RepID=A0A420EFP2_9ALTE|nr:bifunctional proline dehydrogenase/L-glutamate gamma-semialdehyde dehydrogenase PutA [Alginatibacterium sediminis]RKF19474.1 bifunctional proline dehydrogenase/L-glutamate gamma-semialdehyde dehydrogenase PutA [Alginatibacterium sediminis]
MFKASSVLESNNHSATLNECFEQICANYGVDEAAYLEQLIALVPSDNIEAITQNAHQIVMQVRQVDKKGLSVGIDAFLQQYSLETQEGIILMCLAEALLRIPDAATADALIEDKLSGADWNKHLKGSDSLLVNASTWGLMLTGKLVSLDKTVEDKPAPMLGRLINKMGEPVIRQAMYAAMKLMGGQFVLGRDISEALKHSTANRSVGYTHSYDMLGEAALTQADADNYFNDYYQAISALGAQDINLSQAPAPTISIKLSALHPRYELANSSRVFVELRDTVLKLVRHARALQVGISIDAEEADRLELSLELFERIYRHRDCQGWGDLGLVVQAYSKRALPVLVWINTLAAEQGDLIPVRLVKGAYWDSEIKWCQQNGSSAYPVFTRKAGTDVSYLACSRYLLSDATCGNIYPQFASHNAQTCAAILAMAADRDFEFQRLHGMGQELYDTLLTKYSALKVRIYAPVGAHKNLLPYLVRRLLENGANTSFVHKLLDPNTPIESLVSHPLTLLQQYPSLNNPKIVTPEHIFNDRRNSRGLNFNLHSEAAPFFAQSVHFAQTQWHAAPLIGGEIRSGDKTVAITNPFDRSAVGSVIYSNSKQIEEALVRATAAFVTWRSSDVELRAQALEKLADLLELNRIELICLCTREAGKSIPDGVDEVREAVDFCRYYAQQARTMMASDPTLPGPTGELNLLYTQGRGTFLCISPWNFPLAIFLGQIAAALVTGNCVIAKPAEQTNLVAFRATQLAHQAGIPCDVLQLLPGIGSQIGPILCADERINGVCFTGSSATAKQINRTLAARDGAIVPLVAETGGQNAMLVDSSSLPEQVITDVIHSAFQSAGQRCSALRVLYIQEDVAPRMLSLLKGAMAQLSVGDPSLLSTDVGPVIDSSAKAKLETHIDVITKEGELIAQSMIPSDLKGHFVSPTAVKIDSIAQLKEEHFGPVLHVITYPANRLPLIIDEINATGFGLTLGIHSRNESLALQIANSVNVGNAYINRNQIGAVVGVQPFGGQGLSGTGPKAGGPHYLTRFITEKTISNNITAIGGNTTLLSLGDG